MKQFLPFLTDDQGRSLTVENEVVVTRSIPDPLDNSPDGWENSTVQFARNNEFRGIIKSYTTSLKFYLQGAKILRDAFYRKGMEAILYFIWLKQNLTFGAGMKYEGWYKGEPDFGTFKDEYNGVSVNITEGGFFKNLQSNKSVVQEIGFDNDTVMVLMDGMYIQQSAGYIVTNGVQKNEVGFFGRHSVDIPLVTTESATQVNALTQNRYHFTDNDTLLANVNPFLTTGAAVQTINIKAKFGVTVTLATGITPLPGAGSQLLIRAFNSDGIAVDFFIIDQWGNASNLYNIHHVCDIDTTIVAPSNARLYLLMFLTLPNGTGGIDIAGDIDQTVRWDYDNADSDVFNLSYSFKFKSTIIKAFRAFDLGNKLTAKVSTGASLTSPLLEPDFNLLVTSGDAIRGLPNAVIKSSLSDYHKSIDAVKCISLDVVSNNPVIKSRYDDFNKNSSIAQLGECSNWTLEPAEDYIYDSVQVGYPSKGTNSINDINGKYSPNNTFTWAINVTRRKVNLYDAVSKYFADPFDIELIRLNLDGKDTTTANTDNSNFFVDGELKQDFFFTGTTHFNSVDNQIEITGDTAAIEQFLHPGVKYNVFGSLNSNGVYTIDKVINITPFASAIFKVKELVAVDEDATVTLVAVNLYKLRRLPYASITGVPNDGTIFNIELSPRRILENHLRWLRSSFDHLDQSALIFKTTDKNADLVTVDAVGNVISEKASIPVSSMGEKVYLPYYTSFDIKSPDNLLALMTANSYGKFDYTMNGLAMDGFPIDVKTEDTHLETQTYKLLQTANNDNTRLINSRFAVPDIAETPEIVGLIINLDDVPQGTNFKKITAYEYSIAKQIIEDYIGNYISATNRGHVGPVINLDYITQGTNFKYLTEAEYVIVHQVIEAYTGDYTIPTNAGEAGTIMTIDDLTNLDDIAQGTNFKYLSAAEYVTLQQIILTFTTP